MVFFRKLLVVVFFCVSFSPLLKVGAGNAAAQAGDGFSLISAVNGLRVAYGLPPYNVNNALIAAAQAHSDYQASLGTFTHTGSDGSNETQRAIAAGYGSGSSVLCDEAVGWGPNLSPQGIVDLWQDPAHLAIMISAVFKDAGGGVSVTADNKVFYTLDVCVTGSGSGSASDNQPAPAVEQVTTPFPTLLPVIPVQTSTPRSDGSVIHIIQSGQTLITIADAYGVRYQDLLGYNGLTEKSVIFPGDPLLIKLPSTSDGTPATPATASPTSEKQVTPSPTSTSTRKPPTRTPTAEPATAIAMLAPPGAENPRSPDLLNRVSEVAPQRRPDYLLFAIVILGGTGIALVMLGSALKRST